MKPGYYMIKLLNEWQPAKLYNGKWHLIGTDLTLRVWEVEEVGEEIVKR